MMLLSSLIGGAWRDGSGAALTSTAPATGELLADGKMSDPVQARAAMEAAAGAFGHWRRTPFAERRAIVERFAEIASRQKDEMARLIAKEAGKALWDAATEAGAIAGKAALSIKAYHERTPTRQTEQNGATLRLAHKPHGVMVVIGPFNFPGHLPNGQIIPALLAGNTVVFKPSEQTPAVGQHMMTWWQEAGLPDGVVNLVHGGREVAETLVTDARTGGVLFTGGVDTGRAIHRALAGRPDVLLALELGGNNPIVAWDVARAEDAARVIIRSAYITTGQRCTCARRLIVEDGPAGERIVDAVRSLIPRLTIGQPEVEPVPFMGPLISGESAERAISAQQDLVDGGARPILAMERSDAGAAFVTPGLIDVTDMQHDPDEEIFGPLLKVIRVKTYEEALDRANATRFGLAASLLSDSEDLWRRFDGEIRAGIVNWNRQTTGASGAMSFGGPGLSGNHRPAGYYAADFAAWPMASILAAGPLEDDQGLPGIAE